MNAIKPTRNTYIVFAIIAVLFIILVIGLLSNRESIKGGTMPYNGHGGTFKNTLTEIDSPDPSIIYREGFYYMTFTHNGTDIMIMKSRTLDFRQAERKVVWYPPVDTMYSASIWAPEIQYLRGEWYIYFAADNGSNENHRMYALKADTEDPLGSYSFQGQIKDDSDKWAIDGLVLEQNDKLYWVWSGWEGDVNIAQNTYIAAMSDPLTVSGPRVLLSAPDLEWERAGGPPYINEGQAILKKDGRVFLMYSGAGSWTPMYSLGVLTLEAGADPLVASNWRKSQQPLMKMDEEAGVYGPGHNTFVTSPDGAEDWIVYHATSGLHDGWSNRKARAQKIVWTDASELQLSKPLSLDTAITVPSGSGVFSAEHAVMNDQRLEFALIPSSVQTEAPLMIHYQNSTLVKQIATIWVNDQQVTELELPILEGDNIGYVYTTIPLQSGFNKISVSAIATAKATASDPDLGNSEHILGIELPRYEAEAGQSHGATESTDNPFASGWGVARLMEGSGKMLSFDEVIVPDSRSYQIEFAISNPTEQEQHIEVKINGGHNHKVTIPPTGRNIYKRIQLESQFVSGNNQVTLHHASGRLDVDYMDIRN